MQDNEKVSDPLKPLNQVCEPDERNSFFVYGLADIHSELSVIILNDSVPVDVRQLFETAKNLSLYSWYAYRFHQVSELIGYSSLEMALRERYIAEHPEVKPKERPRGLYALLQHAKSQKWITNEGFPSLYNRALQCAEQRKVMDIMKNNKLNQHDIVEIEEPSVEEIEIALADLDMVSAISDNAHKLRNNLAHGSNTLHPNSISTLISVSEVINQLYP